MTARAPAAAPGLEAELERVRLENETLSGVVSVVTSSPDLGHVLDRVVDLLTRATGCHACFVYLTAGDRLRLRAASPVYAHLVGRVEFGVDEGLAGWAVRHQTPAFIRDGALSDPRTHYVPELEEERFQSMVAIPIPARAGRAIGAVVLHTVAPHEFDEGIINVLSRAASLLAGAIENAQLYEESRLRVDALTRLSDLAARIAAATGRAELYDAATAGVAALLPCDVCRFYELDGERRPRLVAADPPARRDAEGGEEGAAVLALLEGVPARGTRRHDALAELLELPEPPGAALAVAVEAGDERLGILVAAAGEPWHDDGPRLLRSIAHQIAVALDKAALIERLTEENVARDLFDALGAERFDVAAARARAAGIDVERPHVVLEVRPRTGVPAEPWPDRGERLEASLRRLVVGAVCDLDTETLRVLVPAVAEGTDAARQAVAGLERLAAEHDAVVGASGAMRGARQLGRGLTEARHAAIVGAAVLEEGGVLLYRDTGAYRYLIGLLEQGGPRDHLQDALRQVVDYDRRRRSQLLLTLEAYLAHGRSLAATARSLTIHVNTLRQRLDRVERVSGLSLADEDLLALQLAIKLAKVGARREEDAS